MKPAKARPAAARSATRRASPVAPSPDRPWARHLVLVSVLLLSVCLAWRTETSRDFGFHLATGRWILAHHAWPRVDSFTYTRAGTPYIDMHGLFQIALAFAARAGMVGVGLLRVGFVLATIVILWVHARRRGVGGAELLGLGFGLALCTWEVRITTRPELASALCLAAQLLLLRRHAETRDRLALYATIPLQLLWVYSHALSVFGIAVLGLYAAASLVEGWRRHDVDVAPWLALAGAVAVMFLNPYGPRGVVFLWELHTRLESGNAFGETIGELMSPFSPEAAGVPALRAFRVMLVVTAFVVLLRARRLPLFDIAVVGLFGALAAVRMRMVGLFAVAALPVALQAASDWGARMGASFARARTATITLVLLVLLFTCAEVVTGGYDAWNRYPFRFGYGESPGTFPVATVAYLNGHAISGRLFNTLDFGGYLLARRQPPEPVFIDGRLEVVGEAFYREYMAAATPEGWRALVARYQPTLALVSSTDHDRLQTIAADSAWFVMGVDGAGVLFARETPDHRTAIAEAARQLARLNAPAVGSVIQPPAPASPLIALLAPQRYPFDAIGRGKAFALLGMLNAARREYRRALLESTPPSPGLVESYAAVTAAVGNVDEGRTWCRWLVATSPHNAEARELLAQLEAQPATR